MALQHSVEDGTDAAASPLQSLVASDPGQGRGLGEVDGQVAVGRVHSHPALCLARYAGHLVGGGQRHGAFGWEGGFLACSDQERTAIGDVVGRNDQLCRRGESGGLVRSHGTFDLPRLGGHARALAANFGAASVELQSPGSRVDGQTLRAELTTGVDGVVIGCPRHGHRLYLFLAEHDGLGQVVERSRFEDTPTTLAACLV
mmetsp:Transcript_94318/g.196921  ORF Transcript_94318/g.196921 Transcript_94318/m.196921 type:complete len:201 (+) Transcript_94318:3229-3831(+)